MGEDEHEKEDEEFDSGYKDCNDSDKETEDEGEKVSTDESDSEVRRK